MKTKKVLAVMGLAVSLVLGSVSGWRCMHLNRHATIEIAIPRIFL